jgi:hypothetical protein
MGNAISAYYGGIGLSMAKTLTDNAMGKHLSQEDMVKALKMSPEFKDNGDGSFTSGPATVTITSDDDLIIKIVNPADGGSVTMRISDELNHEGDYAVAKSKFDLAGLTPDQNEALQDALSEYLDPNDMYGRKNKAYGSSKGKDDRHGGLDSGDGSTDSNWFIALAEVLGESLNNLADDITSQTNKVKLLKNGSAPFKDSMRLQGLAQQLSFMTQAFMTCLNSIGEAIKNSVTAGGAAR